MLAVFKMRVDTSYTSGVNNATLISNAAKNNISVSSPSSGGCYSAGSRVIKIAEYNIFCCNLPTLTVTMTD